MEKELRKQKRVVYNKEKNFYFDTVAGKYLMKTKKCWGVYSQLGNDGVPFFLCFERKTFIQVKLDLEKEYPDPVGKTKRKEPFQLGWNLSAEINSEIKRAFEKHGYQNIPSVDPQLEKGSIRMFEEYELPSAIRAKFLCDTAFKRGELTHTHIIVEELCEAVECGNDQERRKELIQLAAMVINWINYIDNE